MPRVPRKTCRGLLSAGLLLTASCANSKTVYVPDGEPMRLGEPVRALVWIDPVGDGKLELSRTRVTIPEGFWCSPQLFPNDPDDYVPGAKPPATRQTDR